MNSDTYQPTSSKKPSSQKPSVSQTSMSLNNKPLPNNPIAARRSKRSRKCKSDLSLIVSSNFKIRQIKSQVNLNLYKKVSFQNVLFFHDLKIATNLTRLISEQHLFFRDVELENDKTLGDYLINEGDIILLKVNEFLYNL